MRRRADSSPRPVHSARPRGSRRRLMPMLLFLLVAVPATAQSTKRFSLGLNGAHLSAGTDFASTGTAHRSTAETVAFASAETGSTELYGLELGFRAHRLVALRLGLMPAGELPMDFRAVCDPCELLDTDPLTGEDYVFFISSFDNQIEADLDFDLTTLDVSFVPPLSRWSRSEERRFELFVGPTLAKLDGKLRGGEGLRGVHTELEIENNVGAHLGFVLRATRSWTFQAMARWFPTVMTLDYRTTLTGEVGSDPRPVTDLTVNAPLGRDESDWIFVSLGTSWWF